MKFKSGFLLFLLFCPGICFCQENPFAEKAFPSIVPPSPELSSLANIGTLSAQNQTGAATVQLPLYELKAGSISMPLALNYSTNGIKVNDIPGRVGLGWNLLAGGSITRIIHGEDDFYEGRQFLSPPATFQSNTYNLGIVTYLYEAATHLNFSDTEKDEFSFNVNGMSGKFYLDDEGNGHLEEQSDISIKMTGEDAFVLTTGTGIKYFFGENKEVTVDVKLNGNEDGVPTATTGWFLWKITSPEGDMITFNYQSLNNSRYFLGRSQVAIFAADEIYNFNPAAMCHYCDRNQNQGTINPIHNNWTEYNTQYLTSIHCNNGIGASFEYESRNDDTHDKRLTYITISTEAATIRKYKFEYDDYPITNDNQKRFYLTKLSSLPWDGSGLDPLVHQFEYDDPGGLPSEKSLAQDYFGYYNYSNGPNSEDFFPRLKNYEAYTNGYRGANRSPNFNYAKKGSLTKVIYPTGGYREFVYEPHTMAVDQSSFTHEYISQSCAGYLLDDPHTITRPFSIGSTSTKVTLTLVTHQNPQGPVQGQINYWPAGDGKIITTVRIRRASDNAQVWVHTYTVDFLNPAPYDMNLPLNTNYILELTVKGSTWVTDLQLKFNEAETITKVNAAGCGIRVKKINSFDPVTGKTTSVYYTYATLRALGAALGKEVPNDDDGGEASENSILSSGKGALESSYESSYPTGTICYLPTGSPGIDHEVVERCDHYMQSSSSSVSGSYMFGASPIAYSSIIESDDPDFIHGGTEHQYYTSYNPSNVLPLLNNPMESHMGFGYDLNGKESVTRVFKSTTDQFIVLKKEETIYAAETRGFTSFLNYTVRQRFPRPEAQSANEMTMETRVSMYDVGEYGLTSAWNHVESRISTSYDEDGLNPLVQQTDYTYDDIVSKQPTQIITTNSRQEQIKQVLKYPEEFTNISPYPDMVDAHITTPVIEQATINSDKNIYTVYNDYAIWTDNNNIIKPSQVRVQKGNNDPEVTLKYNRYDDNGNPLDIESQAGINKLYYWNYGHTFPVAEISKASLSTTAYTGFEGDDKGGWTFEESGKEWGGITGHYSFSGDMEKQVPGEQKYIVTLWTKSEVRVNNVYGTFVKAKGLWNLYKWQLSDVSLVKVEGQHYDEVRLIPLGATITSYTYDPFIGVTAVNDNNNNIIYYEYDAFNRLVRVRDIDQDILKQYEYAYGQQITPCSNTTADWVLTGTTKCGQDIHDHNNYTGRKYAEKRDMNTCSPTYQQTSWVEITPVPQGECQYVPNCTTADCWVVNGVAEQGVKKLVSSSHATGTWLCSYIYEWSDGHQSTPFTEDSGETPCTEIIIATEE